MSLFKGLIAATLTPMNPDATLNLDSVPQIVEHLIASGVDGLYVCGSTGEGPSLSSDQRMKTAQAYIDAALGRIPVMIQVGHNSITEASSLARHAMQIGADAISAVPPNYFKCDSTQAMIDSFREITANAPDLPFFYYHIPAMTGVQVDMIDFMEEASTQLPAFAGIKFSDFAINEFQQCLNLADGKYTILFGRDEALLGALAVGATGAVGSTYNFAAPLYRTVIDSFAKGDLDIARTYQLYSAKLCRLLAEYKGLPAIKAMMKIIDLDIIHHRVGYFFCNLRPDINNLIVLFT